MGFLPKVINYNFGSLSPVEILAEAEAQIATRYLIAVQRVGKLNLLADQKQLGWD